MLNTSTPFTRRAGCRRCGGAVVGAILLGGAAPAQASQPIEPESLIGKCLKAVGRTVEGEATRLWAKREERGLVYEFEGEAPDGTRWRIECDALTQAVSETEREVAKTAPEFVAQAKVSEEEARLMAVSALTGEVLASRYIIESDGTAAYEFDVRTTRDVDFRIEVEAATGRFLEVNPVLWDRAVE